MHKHAFYRKHQQTLLQMGVELYESNAYALNRHLYMYAPTQHKTLGLHSKLTIIDKDITVIGSANFDSRSLNINSEVLILIKSKDFTNYIQNLVQKISYLKILGT